MQILMETESGSVAPGNIATAWNESKNVKWKTEIHGKGWSTPVITEEQIWMTTATEDGKKMYAVLSRETEKSFMIFWYWKMKRSNGKMK